MNWDVISAASSTISSIAVVGSVIYLSLQIRQSNNISQGQTRTEFRNMAGQELFKVIDHPEVLRCLLDDTAALTTDQKIRVYEWLLGCLRMREYIWLQHRAGLLDSVTFQTYSQSIRHILSSNRGRRWWHEFKSAGFHAEFVRFVDDQLERNPTYDFIKRLACLD